MVGQHVVIDQYSNGDYVEQFENNGCAFDIIPLEYISNVYESSQTTTPLNGATADIRAREFLNQLQSVIVDIVSESPSAHYDDHLAISGFVPGKNNSCEFNERRDHDWPGTIFHSCISKLCTKTKLKYIS